MPITKQTASLEQYANAKYDRQLESYEARYSQQFEAIAKSNTFKGHLSKNDMYTLGSQIDNYKKYEAYVQENASASSLGALPRVALDLISATYALTIAPQLASMQTIEDAQGIVYFKKAITQGYPLTATAGLKSEPEARWMNADGSFEGKATYNGKWKTWHNHAAAGTGSEGASSAGKLVSEDISAKNYDAVTFSALQGWQSSPTAYMSERQIAKVTNGTATLANVIGHTRWNMPINMRLVSAAGKVVDLMGMQSGPDQLPTFYGTVKVNVSKTGDDMILVVDSDEYVNGAVAYDIDFEKAPDVPAIEFSLTSDIVTAEIMGVKEMMGTFKSFQFNKRFGKTASDEQLADLSGHMAMAESEKVLAALAGAADTYTPITWNINRPQAVSEYEHRQSFLYTIQAASAAIGSRCGKGYANRIAAGYVACQYIASLPGWKPAPTTNLVGPHVYGTLENEGITVIRTNNVLAPNEMICCYMSDNSPFEAPVVDATYMPVFVTDTLPVANNPFQSQRAIAAWKAIKSIVPQFVQRIVLTKIGDTAADVNVFLTGTPSTASSTVKA